MAKQSATVGSSTYETIRRDIIFGHLEPGAKLKLESLRGHYAASVSTLRETLNRLASEGFVVAAEQRGFFVAPVSRHDLEEIASLRVLLESHALEASFANGDAEWEGDVVSAYHKLHLMEERMRVGDLNARESWKQYDWAFHQTLIQACNSQNLRSLHATVFDKYLRYQFLVLTYRGEAGAVEHKALLDAALERDVHAAQTTLRTHIEGGLEHALAAFKE